MTTAIAVCQSSADERLANPQISSPTLGRTFRRNGGLSERRLSVIRYDRGAYCRRFPPDCFFPGPTHATRRRIASLIPNSLLPYAARCAGPSRSGRWPRSLTAWASAAIGRSSPSRARPWHSPGSPCSWSRVAGVNLGFCVPHTVDPQHLRQHQPVRALFLPSRGCPWPTCSPSRTSSPCGLPCCHGRC